MLTSSPAVSDPPPPSEAERQRQADEVKSIERKSYALRLFATAVRWATFLAMAIGPALVPISTFTMLAILLLLPFHFMSLGFHAHPALRKFVSMTALYAALVVCVFYLFQFRPVSEALKTALGDNANVSFDLGLFNADDLRYIPIPFPFVNATYDQSLPDPFSPFSAYGGGDVPPTGFVASLAAGLAPASLQSGLALLAKTDCGVPVLPFSRRATWGRIGFLMVPTVVFLCCASQLIVEHWVRRDTSRRIGRKLQQEGRTRVDEGLQTERDITGWDGVDVHGPDVIVVDGFRLCRDEYNQLATECTTFEHDNQWIRSILYMSSSLVSKALPAVLLLASLSGDLLSMVYCIFGTVTACFRQGGMRIWGLMVGLSQVMLLSMYLFQLMFLSEHLSGAATILEWSVIC
ncbi:hypothetical protein PAPYR_6396 [Paratrimastix pyriformis]|uniref:Uncharacterized protein n=1 Tax=Paratrimastix pyriformis TaxID=342808 RepID=A0ABQ8UIH3_9EUKA|nr:hypothetical protein PAPYR_6396 [Paratrimastix pyriformis]